jgi:hypothetical protein
MAIKNILFVMLFALATLGARCQDEHVITKIQFSSLTRGYQKEVFISADSLTTLINDRGQEKISKRKLAAGEWEELVTTISKIDPTGITELPSPTSRRAFDGARHSTITIIAREAGPWTHSFDDELPHEKLQPLMDVLRKVMGSEPNQK